MNVPYIWQCHPGLSWVEAKEANKLFLYFQWFFDKIGWFMERTPLVLFSCGFWISVFIKLSTRTINDYAENKIEKEIALKKTAMNDKLMYVFVSAGFGSLLIFLVLPAVVLFAGKVGSFSFAKLPLILLFVLFASGVIHEFACSSSNRLWRESIRRGEFDIAQIINGASPSIKNYLINL